MRRVRANRKDLIRFLFQLREFYNFGKEGLGRVYHTQPTQKHPMGAIGEFAYPNKVRGADFPQEFVDAKVPVGKEGERHLVPFFEGCHFKIRVSSPKAEDFNFALKFLVFFYELIERVYVRGVGLAVWAVHAKYLQDDYFCLELRDAETAVQEG
jgi:hypothetical protein